MEEQSQQAAPSEQSQAQTPAPTPTKPEPPPALLDEIKSLRAERAQLREQVADLTGKIEQAQGLEAQLTTTRRDLDLARAGLTDPEAIAVAEVIWGDCRPTLARPFPTGSPPFASLETFRAGWRPMYPPRAPLPPVRPPRRLRRPVGLPLPSRPPGR